MVELYNLLVAALASISGLTVIEGSLASTEKNYPLPAAVIDFEPTQFEPMTEDGSILNMTPAYSIILHVAEQPSNRSAERTAILALLKDATDVIAAMRYSFIIRDVYIDYVPFGLEQSVLGCGLLVRFQNVAYNL